MQKWDEAEKHYKLVSNWQADKQSVLCLARFYEKIGKWKEAENTFKMVPNWEQDKQTVLSLARCYEELKQWKQAEKYYEMAADGQHDKQGLLGLARYYQLKGKFTQAINTFQMIANWQNDRQALLGLACCYEKMDRREEAEKYYKSIVNWQQDKEVLLGLAYCYQHTKGQFKQAVNTFKMIANWENDKQALLGLGRTYEDIRQCQQAEKYYKKIANWQQDKQALLGLSRCYQKTGQLQQSMTTLQKIPHWQKDKQALLSLARCYETMGQFEKAESTFKMIVNWQKDKKVLLSLVCLYSSVEQEAKCFDMLKQGCTLFVHEPLFFIKLANYYHRHAQSEKAMKLLAELKQNYPYNRLVHLEQIKYYLLVNDWKTASRLAEESEKQFPEHLNFRRQITWLFAHAKYLQLARYADLDNIQKVHLELPGDIKKIFQDFRGIGGDFLLVGGTVLKVLGEKLTLTDNQIDLDFVTNKVFSWDKIQQHNLVVCPYIQGLYTKKMGNKKIDIKQTNSESMHQSFWTIPDALYRDFTICALFLSETGEVLDPTSRGVTDFKQKILRTIGPAKQSLEEDPVRILRAAKYMARGYKPTAELALALKGYAVSKITDEQRAHLLAVTRKLLFKVEAGALLSILHQYGLLKKLYGFESVIDVNLVDRLKVKLGIGPVIFNSSHINLSDKRESGKYIKCLALQEDPAFTPLLMRYKELQTNTLRARTTDALDLMEADVEIFEKLSRLSLS